MIETEAKIRLNKKEFEILSKILGNPYFLLQKNWGYLLSNGLIRIREEGKNKFLTFKKSNQKKQAYNSREEIEFRIANAKLIRRIFHLMNLGKEYYYKKKRATTQIENCVICLDNISEKGYFLEVEGKSKNIRNVLKKFRLDKKPVERRNYFEIVKNGLH